MATYRGKYLCLDCAKEMRITLTSWTHSLPRRGRPFEAREGRILLRAKFLDEL